MTLPGGAGRWLAAHRKAVVAAAGAAITVALEVWGPGNPYVSLAVLVATSLGVYGAPNRAAEPPPAVSLRLAEPAGGEAAEGDQPRRG